MKINLDRCVCCDAPVSEHGPYMKDDCLCRKCCEAGVWLDPIPTDPKWVRRLHVACWVVAIALVAALACVVCF